MDDVASRGGDGGDDSGGGDGGDDSGGGDDSCGGDGGVDSGGGDLYIMLLLRLLVCLTLFVIIHFPHHHLFHRCFCLRHHHLSSMLCYLKELLYL